MLEPETWIHSAPRAASAAATGSTASAAEPRTEKKKSRPPLSSYATIATAVERPGASVSAVVSTPSRRSRSRSVRPNASAPTAPASPARAPTRAATEAKMDGAPLQNGPCQVPGSATSPSASTRRNSIRTSPTARIMAMSLHDRG